MVPSPPPLAGVLLLLLLQVNGSEIYLVVNAGCRDKDLEHIGKHLAEAKVQSRESEGGNCSRSQADVQQKHSQLAALILC